jgi:hypothetical protein
MRSALISRSSMEHGTPAEVIDFVRSVFGGVIDTDPASSSYWNHWTTKATTYYDRQTDGRTQAWMGRTMVNAPGADDEAKTDSLVTPFWERSIEQWRCGNADGLVWVGFSTSQAGQLQGCPAHPLQFPTIFLCERLKFLKRPTVVVARNAKGEVTRERVVPGPPIPGKAPTHFNFLTLLPTRRSETEAREQLRRFRDRGSILGALVRPFS